MLSRCALVLVPDYYKCRGTADLYSHTAASLGHVPQLTGVIHGPFVYLYFYLTNTSVRVRRTYTSTLPPAKDTALGQPA